MINPGNTKVANLNPLGFFSNLLPNPLEFFERIGNSSRIEASIFNLLIVDPTQSYGENTRSPIHDSHRFRYKTY